MNSFGRTTLLRQSMFRGCKSITDCLQSRRPRVPAGFRKREAELTQALAVMSQRVARLTEHNRWLTESAVDATKGASDPGLRCGVALVRTLLRGRQLREIADAVNRALHA
jgi:hypothetical protein